MVSFRRIDHRPAAGAWNMAVDEALLGSCMRGDPGFPCVRFYGWSPPALSLGFHQQVAGCADLSELAARGIDLVRRPTGGRAVLHDREVTYSVVASCREGPLAGDVMASYRRISEALARGLRGLGLPAELAAGDVPAPRGSAEPCFRRLSAGEIAVAGAKVAGSVQLRRRGTLLQHGSVPLTLDPELVARVTGGWTVPAAGGVAQALGRPLSSQALADALARGFEEQFGARLLPGDLSDSERSRARHLEVARYATPEWTARPPASRPGGDLEEACACASTS